jgi:pyruvate dehydrogenase E2 component (dihydrolipoamide acetyltransferase)
MPSLGADMDEGRVLEWRVQPGDAVVRGQIVAVVETDKADIDVEIFETGVIESLLVPVGEKVAVGTPLALVGTAARPVEPVLVGATATPPAEPVLVGVVAATAAPPPPAVTAPPATATAMRPGATRSRPAASRTHSPVVRHLAERLGVDVAGLVGSGPVGAVTRADVERAAAAPHRARVSPRARRLAAEHGVDLGALTGSGPGGAVVGDDVLVARPPAPSAHERANTAAATEAPPPAPAPAAAPGRSAADKAAAMRQAIARLMARSTREIPHYHVDLDIDLGPALAWLERVNEGRPATARLLPAALLLKATALAAHEVPGINGTWEDDHLVIPETVQLGVAVSLRTGGLVTPAIPDAAALPLDEVMAALRDLVTRARSGHLKASELTGATLTVTNLGDLGADRVSGVIYPPQVALVGFGRVRERPWAEGGMLGVRPVVTATLAADHRASDGLVGSRFLAAVARHLADPDSL